MGTRGLHDPESAANRKSLEPAIDPRVDVSGSTDVRVTFARSVVYLETGR
jgi:hypothetical protein